MSIRFSLSIVFLIFIFSCSQEKKEVSIIKESNQNLEMITAYREGYEALTNNDPYYAAKKFLEAELLFPQSEWAPRSSLMASYSYYMQNYYAEALSNLERYIKTYPTDQNISYAHYLLQYVIMKLSRMRKETLHLSLKLKINLIL